MIAGRATVFCLFFLWASICGFSQFSDSTHYYLKFSGTGNINSSTASGTGTSYIFNNSVRAEVAKKNLSLNLFSGWIYGENGLQKTNNDFISTMDVDLFKQVRRLYYWGLASYEKSYSLKINDRLQAGVGLAYKLLDKTNASIVLSDGILYETTALREPDKYGRDGYQAIRNSFRLKLRFTIKELVTLESTDFFQHALSDGNDYIIRSSSAVSMKLYKWLGLTVGLTYNKQNLNKSENFLLNYGLTMERYF